MLYNTILTSRSWAHSARNMYRSVTNLLLKRIFALIKFNTNILIRRTVSKWYKYLKESYIYSVNLYNIHSIIIVIIVIIVIIKIIIISVTFFLLGHNILQAVEVT